jgi:hypothetical protein
MGRIDRSRTAGPTYVCRYNSDQCRLHDRSHRSVYGLYRSNRAEAVLQQRSLQARSVAVGQVLEAIKCDCMHLVVGHHAGSLLPSCERKRPYSSHDELDLFDLWWCDVLGHELVWH